jgi:hypothetical protein
MSPESVERAAASTEVTVSVCYSYRHVPDISNIRGNMEYAMCVACIDGR